MCNEFMINLFLNSRLTWKHFEFIIDPDRLTAATIALITNFSFTLHKQKYIPNFHSL